jgi:hypothetical protein
MKFSELVRLLKRSRAGIGKSSSAEILQSVSICAFGNNQSDPIDPDDTSPKSVRPAKDFESCEAVSIAEARRFYRRTAFLLKLTAPEQCASACR